MTDNLYESPSIPHASPSEKRRTQIPRRALAARLILLGGLAFIPCGLIFYITYVYRDLVAPFFRIQNKLFVLPLLLTLLPLWAASRLRRGHGILASGILLLGMIPFVCVEVAVPAFIVFTQTSVSRLFIVVIVVELAYALCYLSAWRCLIRLRKGSARESGA